MASSYPTSLDSFTDPTSGSSLASPSHSGQHIDLNDAVEKLETKLGIGSSPASSAAQGAVLKANGSGTTTYAKAGMWLVKTDTITSGSSKEITGAFTDEFDFYRIIIANVALSALTNLMFRFGTDATAYYGSNYIDRYDGSATLTNRTNNGAGLYVGLGESGNSGSNALFMDVWGVRTSNSQKGIQGTMYGAGYSGWFGGVRVTSSSYTSFTLYTLGGQTFTSAQINIYGYQK